MELTPQAVSDAEFREAKRGGYNIRDVDDFLDQISVGVGQLHERVRDAHHRAEAAEANLVEAQRQIEEARRSAPLGPAMPGAPGPAMPGAAAGETDETLRRTLMLAQRTADATIAEAKEEAARVVQAAQGESDQIRAEAEAEALGDVAVAREEAERRVEQLRGQRAELENDIAKLEDHLEAQRANLRAGLDDLQQLLEDRESLQVEPPPELSDADEVPGPPPLPLPPRRAPAADRSSDRADRPKRPEQPPEPMFPVPGPEESSARNGFVAGTRLSSEELSPFGAGREDEPLPPNYADAGPFAPPVDPPVRPPADMAPDFPAAPLVSPVADSDSFGAEPERPPLPVRGAREPQGPSRVEADAPPLPSRSPEPFPAFEPPPERDPFSAPLSQERDPFAAPLPEPGPPLGVEPLPVRDPLPRRESPNVAELQELSGQPPFGAPPESDAASDDGEGVRAIFPPSLGPPPGASGFLPDLPHAPTPGGSPAGENGAGGSTGVVSDVPAFPPPPQEPANGNHPLSIDSSLPPPAPPGMEPLRDAGGLPVESGDRPSAWGRGGFDEDAGEEDATGIRFGRK